eukprot:153133_1
MEPLLAPSSSVIKSPKLTYSDTDGKLINELRSGPHTSIIHSARSTVSNGDRIQEEQKLQINGLYDNDYESTMTTGDPTITGAEFDDLEFLHDFLEHESKRPFYESTMTT